MKVLWLCNNAPGMVRSALSGKQESQVNWLDHVLQDLLDQGIAAAALRVRSTEGAVMPRCRRPRPIFTNRGWRKASGRSFAVFSRT